MSLDIWLDSGSQHYSQHHNHCFGVVIGIVTNNDDPKGLGRVKLKFPWLSETHESSWARVATLMTGNDSGSYFLPDVKAEVLVAFDHGDLRFPYVLGSLWNGIDKPPVQNTDGKNNLRVLKSRSGHLIRLDDTERQERIEIIDKSGNNSLVFDTTTNEITIAAEKNITLSAPKGAIKIKAQTIQVESTLNTQMTAKSTCKIQAEGNMDLKGAMINLN
jgi:uncharacterized protein involved in type VI secretion and phage assembly